MSLLFTYWHWGTFFISLGGGLFLAFMIYCYVYKTNEGPQFLKWLLSSVGFSVFEKLINKMVSIIGIYNLPEYEQNLFSDKLSILKTEFAYNFIFFIAMIVLGICMTKYYNSKNNDSKNDDSKE